MIRTQKVERRKETTLEFMTNNREEVQSVSSQNN